MPTVTIIENGSQTGSIDTEQETGDYQGENRIAELVVESVEDGVSNTTNDEDQDTDDGELLPPSKSVDVSGDKLVEFVTGNLDVAGVEYDVEGVELAQRDFRNLSIDTSKYEPWEDYMLEMHDRVWSNDDSKQLVGFSESQMPEFIKERLRDVIISGEALFGDIQGISDSELMSFRTQMADGLTQDGWTIGDITGRLQDVQPELSRSEAETIARTETASAVNTAREKGYEETGMEDERFYWTGATQAEQPDRTTSACDWLIQKTNPNHGGTPVSLSRLKELIDEAPSHDPEMQDDLARPDNFCVHPNERKTFVRHVE